MTFDYNANYQFRSRRSVVLAPNAAVASSQPLATEAGLRVLREGGSAADAAIAVAAALQVTQACSTGLGGDAFCLYYDASVRKVSAYNGSGRSPAALTLEMGLEAARRRDPSTPGDEVTRRRDPSPPGDEVTRRRDPSTPGDEVTRGRDPSPPGDDAARRASTSTRGAYAEPHALPLFHPHTVTVPGAADAWVEVHRRFGRLPLDRVLRPAVELARGGFSLEPMTSIWWSAGAERQLSQHRHGGELMIEGRAPRVGERLRNPGLARVLEALASEGRDVFYDGWIAERIVAELEYEGGVMTRDDLAAHRGEWVEPISIRYGDYDVWECPPNGQGLAALLALNAYGQVRGRETASAAEALHAQVEAMRLGFADAARFVADPAFAPAPLAELLSTQYAVRRAALIDPGRAMDEAGPGLPATTVGDDTVYFSVVDAEGNGCSFINSNFMGFGTGIVPQGCGFSLQNRGRGFVLDAGHANALMPGKRPYHTIIPGLLTHASGDLAAVFGVMGGMMQPQGHLQVVSHLIDAMLDPQSALDAPRFQLADGDSDGTLLVEDSTAPDLVHALEERGHRVTSVSGTRRATFGLGQIIASGGDGVLWAGSDPRGDGHAGGF